MNSEQFLIETELDNGSRPQVKAVDARVVKSNVDRLIGLIQQFGEGSGGDLELDEVNVSIKIAADGSVVLVGGGASANTAGMMTLRFRRGDSAAVGRISPPPGQAASGIDLTNLQNLLAGGQWQAANQETWDLMCKALHKNKGSYLSPADMQALPCQILNEIDRLWQHHSQGRYGFGIQKQAYKASISK